MSQDTGSGSDAGSSGPWYAVNLEIPIVNPDGYEAEVSLVTKNLSVTSDTSQAPPGKTDIVVGVEGTGQIRNTMTGGRSFPLGRIEVVERLIAYWKPGSYICKYGFSIKKENGCEIFLIELREPSPDTGKVDEALNLWTATEPVRLRNVPEAEAEKVKAAVETGADALFLTLDGPVGPGNPLKSPRLVYCLPVRVR